MIKERMIELERNGSNALCIKLRSLVRGACACVRLSH